MERIQIIRDLQKVLDEKYDYLILEFDNEKNYFIQFIKKSNTILTGEVVSNEFLESPYQLTKNQIELLNIQNWKQVSSQSNFSKQFFINKQSDFESIVDEIFQIIETIFEMRNYTIRIID